MASVQENIHYWDNGYEWPQSGNEWSFCWGGPEMQWKWAIQPRIQPYLSCGTIVEIAPGLGRWTGFLLKHASQLVGIDVSKSCIDACRSRYSSYDNACFFVNDGRTLPQVQDGTADFVFSFDSLVHAESIVIESYVEEISRVLSSDGAAFIHHSNLGEYPFQVKFSGIPFVRTGLRLFGVLEKRLHWRAHSMTAEKMVNFAMQHDLRCIKQELVNWGTRNSLIDCFSILVRPNSKWDQDCRVLRNKNFMDEARLIRNASALYG